jgi:hypothetical protein
MNCKEVIELIPDYIEELLGKDVHDEVTNHLSGCNACKDELDRMIHMERILSQVKEEETPKQVDFAFQMMLENEKSASRQSLSAKINQKHISLSTLIRVAAGLLLLISGGFIGYYIRPAEKSTGEVASLKQEMVEMKNLVILSLIKQESPSERIKAVSYIKEISKPDPKLIETLFSTLNNDRNVNVRLAAAQALSKYKDNKEIARGIVKSLEKQTEPLVQIMLINLAVETGSEDVAPELNKMLKRSDLMDEVKSYAKKGIKSLTI